MNGDSLANARSGIKHTESGPDGSPLRTLITGGAGFIGCNLGDAMAAKGRPVTIFDNLSRPRSDPERPKETMNGADVVRRPVAARVSKGMPSLGTMAQRLMEQHDIMSLHLPQFDAAGLSLRARLIRKPVVLTYHCDLQLPAG